MHFAMHCCDIKTTMDCMNWSQASKRELKIFISFVKEFEAGSSSFELFDINFLWIEWKNWSLTCSNALEYKGPADYYVEIYDIE